MLLYKRKIQSIVLGSGAAALFVAGGLSAILAGETTPKFEKDRAAILAMAGAYKVHFRFEETVALEEGYALVEAPYTAEGTELVKVIRDDQGFISLQHILVVNQDGSAVPVKHWRQDWIYQPDKIMEYCGHGQWGVEALDPEKVRGKWLQAVYQVDDSPRYASLGGWSHAAGASSWTSGVTRRPLPRREKTKRDDYDVLVSVNRHTITPDGWVHEQDNTKLAMRDEGNQAIAREIGVNTYRRFDGFDIGAAEAYWEKTEDFWKLVRAYWDAQATPGNRIAITPPAGDPVLWDEVRDLAQKVEQGELATRAAIGQLPEIFGTYVHKN